MIAKMLDNLAIGDTFKPSALHITILPWFALETEELPFLNWFYKHFKSVEAFDSIAASRTKFGPKKDVPVTIMEPKEKFMELHQLALSWFGEVGARWAERDPYVGDDFIPHIAQRRGFVVEEGQKIHIGSLTLFKAKRHDDQVRVVAAKAVFNDKD
jgi:2'-5' RNA ligase